MNWLARGLLVAVMAFVVVALPAALAAQTPTLEAFAHYRLGEEDLGTPTAGGAPQDGLTLDSVVYNGIERDFIASGDPRYSDNVPPGGYSTLSMQFDGLSDVGNTATQWHGQTLPNGLTTFRIGMEAWVWVDPVMQGQEFVPFANGGAMGFVGTAEGQWRFFGDFGGPPTPNAGAIAYGEWQHIALNSSGSHWNFYLNGDQTIFQHFGNYGATGGDATIGGDSQGLRKLVGNVDEARISRWISASTTDRGPHVDDLLIFSHLTPGDVTGDDVVDSDDYDVWRTNVGSDVSDLKALDRLALGDLNHDKLINLDDFSIIKANLTPGASPIPEPSTWVLACIGGALFAARRAVGTRVPRMLVAMLAASACLGVASLANAQAPIAVWNGGDANWTDANWTGGTGPGGTPASTDDVEFHEGTASITSDVGSFGKLFTREAGTLDIEPAGAIQFQNADIGTSTLNGTGVLNVAGRLTVVDTLALARGADGNGNSSGELNISGSAVVSGAVLDAFWGAPAGTISVTGPDADIEFGAVLIGISDFEAHITAATHSAVKAPQGVDLFSEFSNGGESSLRVDFELGDLTPTLGHSWTLFDTSQFTNQTFGTAGRFNEEEIGYLDAPGLRAVVNYRAGGDNGQVLAVDVVSNLNLKVNTGSGEASLENPTDGGESFDIDGYLITSASGSLNAAGFDGLGEAGWAAGLNQSGAVLSESNLLGSTSIATDGSFSLGSIFQTGGTEDLVLEFHVAGGGSIRGTVQYFTEDLLLGDTNGDRLVDLDDLNNVRNFFGTDDVTGDADHDGDTDLDDLNAVRNAFGTGPGAQGVPEPSTAVLALAGLVAIGAVWRRRK